MNPQKRKRLLLLTLALTCTASVAMWVVLVRLFPLNLPAPAPEVHTYTDLETAIANGSTPDWKLHIRPQHPGPYYLLPNSVLVGGGVGFEWKTTGQIYDESGKVIEELPLIGNDEFDQCLIYLETPSGRWTVAALKRMRIDKQ